MFDEIRLIRHATLWIRLGGIRILVDPMFSEKGEMDPVANAGNHHRIPMCPLPFDHLQLREMVQAADVVLITHLHRDHWDEKARTVIPTDQLIFCQPPDADILLQQGFTNVVPVHHTMTYKQISITRTDGRHGTGSIGRKMGQVSGFVLEHGQRVIYIAGDTIWCDEVEETLYRFHPDYTILNAGGAQFSTGGPITMTPDDICKACHFDLFTTIIAVHMDAVNHCHVGRRDLKAFLRPTGLLKRVLIPEDGETISLRLTVER